MSITDKSVIRSIFVINIDSFQSICTLCYIGATHLTLFPFCMIAIIAGPMAPGLRRFCK